MDPSFRGGWGVGHGWWAGLGADAVALARCEKRGGGGKGGAVGFWSDTKSGGGGGGYDRVSGSPGYCTVVEFMRTSKHIKCGPKSYEFINGKGGGGHVPRVPPPIWIRR